MAKEPISSKGPRLSSEITLAGRYIVLAPFSSKISVSQKIRSHEEKKRLKDVMEGLLPKNFGAIIRTVAENKTAEDIQSTLKKTGYILVCVPTVRAHSLSLSLGS